MTRQLLVRIAEGRLPEALQTSMRDEVVLAGWVRASGIVADVTLRTIGTTTPRHIPGLLQAVVIEGSIGLAHGDVSCGLHAVLARDTETGIETFAGEIVEAKVLALEALITAIDDLTATRSVDASGLVLLDPVVAPGEIVKAPVVVLAPPPQAWADTARAAEEPAKPRPSPTFSQSAPMPQRIAKPVKPEEEDQVYPDAGDNVDHFAFGRCEVLKSDGDRLHLRLGKDSRIKEISLDMLKVTEVEREEGQPRLFKLARKL